MSFPLQGLFASAPLDELPAPLPNIATSPLAMPAPMGGPGQALTASMGASPPGASSRVDWSMLLSLVLPALITAMKGGNVAPLGAFYQSFGQARRAGETQRMEQQEMAQTRLKEDEARIERQRVRQVSESDFIGQAVKELLEQTEDFDQFKKLQRLYIGMAHDRNLEPAPIARVQFPFQRAVIKKAAKVANTIAKAYADNPEEAEKVYGYRLGADAAVDSGVKDDAGTPLTFTLSQAFGWADLPTNQETGRPITRKEKEPIPNTPEEQVAALRTRADALDAVGEQAKAQQLRRQAATIIGAARDVRTAGQTPAKPSMSWVVRNNQTIRVKEEDIRLGDLPYTTRETSRRVTSSDANRIAELDTSLDDLDVLKRDLGTTGAASKIGAMLPNVISEVTGWGLDAKSRQAVIDRVKQVIGKALEGGVLRKEDEYKYTKILPTIGDPIDVAQRKLGGLKAALEQRRLRLLEALDDAGFDVSDFQTTAKGGTEKVRPPAVDKILNRIPR